MSPMYDFKNLICSAQVLGNAGDEYTDDEVNFGFASPNVGRGGKFGLHVVVTTTFTGLDSGANIWIAHGTATAPTTKSVGRFFAVADLIAGKHYFIPGPHSILQFARGLFDVVSENATAGAATMWFGPDEDGAE